MGRPVAVLLDASQARAVSAHCTLGELLTVYSLQLNSSEATACTLRGLTSERGQVAVAVR
jgi:hypothetical protein